MIYITDNDPNILFLYYINIFHILFRNYSKEYDQNRRKPAWYWHKELVLEKKN